MEKKITEEMRIDSSGDGCNLSANLGETLSFHARGERSVVVTLRERDKREREEKCFWLLFFLSLRRGFGISLNKQHIFSEKNDSF